MQPIHRIIYYIINEKNITQISIDNSQVFYVESLLGFVTAVAEISVADWLVKWVEVVAYNIAITLMTRRKYNNLKILG